MQFSCLVKKTDNENLEVVNSEVHRLRELAVMSW